MTRPYAVRFLRTEPVMAYPDGRLLAVRAGTVHVLGADGWSPLSAPVPATAEPLTRQDAQDWLRRRDRDPAVLDAVPGEVA